MDDNRSTLAIFDFDGTLTTGHLWLGIARHNQKHKVKRLAFYSYMLSHLPLWVAAKVGLYSDEKNRSKWCEDLPVLLKGFTREEARGIFQWVTTNYFMPLMRPNMLSRIEADRKQGHRIMLLSGMFTDFLEVIAGRLGADYVVGTRLEIRGNRYTGSIVQPLCFGDNKARLLLDYIHRKKLSVDLKQSVAYADSIYDMPVFKLVGRPVAVFPDKELHRLAREKKWEII